MTAAGTEFMDQARCVQFDPDLFAGDRADLTTVAKRVCADCPVRDACYAYAVRHELDGVWGGVLLTKGHPAGHKSAPVGVECAAAGCRKRFVPAPPLWAKRFCSPQCQVVESRARNKRHNALRRRVEVGEGRPPQKALLPNRTTS